MSPDNLKKFEEQLRSIRPQPVHSDLAGRIDSELRQVTRRKRLIRVRSMATLTGVAAAAGLLITFGFLLFNGRLDLDGTLKEAPVAALPVDPDPDLSKPVAKTNPFKQVITENNLQSRIDEGLVFLRNGMTARRYRYQFVDRVVWENPNDGAMVELEVPRDEIVLIPVQTF